MNFGHHDVVRPDDYIFVPSNVLQRRREPRRASGCFIGSRDEATAQESVVLRSEMDEGIVN